MEMNDLKEWLEQYVSIEINTIKKTNDSKRIIRSSTTLNVLNKILDKVNGKEVNL